MSGAKRRINSTGRKRLTRDRFEIRMLESQPSQPLKAQVSIDLAPEDLPGDAKIVLEAYYRSSGMRFDFGTVEAPSAPGSITLDEVDRTGDPLFRIKVIDTGENEGRILASAERIQPRSEDDGEDRKSIFPISYRDLQSDTWKVEIEQGNRPRLIINKRLPGFQYKLAESPLLQGLVLPAALRFVLKELVLASETGEDDDEGSWKDEWLAYCKDVLGAEGDPRDLLDENEKSDWIDDAVRQFGENCDFIDRISRMDKAG